MCLREILITDDQINASFAGANFGPGVETVEGKREAVASAVLKRVCDYGTGSTISRIMQELGLTKTLYGKPTKAARRWMYEVLMR